MADIAPIPGDAVTNQKGTMDQLVQQLLTRATQPRMSMPQPTAKFGPDEMKQEGFNMQAGQTKAQDVGIGLQNMGSLIHNLSAKHKQNQVRDAMSDWQGFDDAMDKAQVLAGDPSAPDHKEKVQKILGEMPWVKSMLDPANPKSVKRLKNMYKAMNPDIFDEKENVYGEGLKQHLKAKKGLEDVQASKEKMEQLRQKTIQNRLTEMMGRSKMGAGDPKQQLEAANIAVDAKKADNAGKEKWEFKQGADDEGKPAWFAFDKTNPNAPAKKVEIDGKQITAATKPNAQQGKVLTIEGKPYGVMGPKGVVTPSDPEFTPDLGRKLSEANKAYAVAEGQKQKLAGIRASTYIASREYAVVDKETKELVMMNPAMINANPGRYAPAQGAMNAMGKEAVFGDIYFNVNNVREAAKNLKNGFTPEMRALGLMSLRSSEPSKAMSTFVSSLAAGKLKPDQIDYLTAIASLQENAQAIRSVAGMGAGSDMLREAILRTVPGAGTPNIQYLNRQLDLFKGTAERLEKGVPGMDAPETGTPKVVTNEKDIPDGR